MNVGPVRERLGDIIRSIFEQSEQAYSLFFIGSVTHTWRREDSQDIDILVVNESQDVRSSTHLETLYNCMENGNALEGSFSTLSQFSEDAFDQIEIDLQKSFPNYLFTSSRCFGPTLLEVDIPENTIHLHIAGEIALGDMEPMGRIFPFHTLEFYKHHILIHGTPLRSVCPLPEITRGDLSKWQELTEARISSAANPHEKQKWEARLQRNLSLFDQYGCKKTLQEPGG